MIGRVIVAGGGTGGHLFPGIAVVEELRRRIDDLDVLFVGTARGIESRLLPQLGERLETLDVTPLKGRAPLELAKSVGRLPSAVGHALTILRRERPDLVIGVGGYASGPLLAAASMLGIPTAVLEQNAEAGLTNRIVGRLIGRAYVTFADSAKSFRQGRARTTGNPVRRSFVEASLRALSDPEGFEARATTILVLGGSQGARSLNELVPAALARVDLAKAPLTVVHQTGASMRAEVERRYEELGVAAQVVPFIDDMARAYANASLVIGRAGATTIAELCAIGRPSVLVPYPFAANDHQTKNAQALERAGATIMVAEGSLTADGLARVVSSITGDMERRTAMADAARKLGRPDAAAVIVDDLCAWLGGPERDHGARRESVTATRGSDGTGEGPDGGASRTRRSRYRVPSSRSMPSPLVAAGHGSSMWTAGDPKVLI